MHSICESLLTNMVHNISERDINISDVEQTLEKNLGGISWNIEYISLAVFLGFFSLVGILGNIPVLIVYFNKREQTASNTFIKVLAILDLTVCSCIMPYTMVYELHMVESDVVCRMFEFLRHFIISSSNITLVAISVERYIAVCRLTRRMSVQHVKRGMIGISILCGGIAAPAVGTFAVVSDDPLSDVHCAVEHRLSNSYCHFTFHILGRTAVLLYQGMLMMTFFVSFLMIVVFYITVYMVLWKRTARRQRSSLQSKYQSKESVCEIAKSKENCACSQTHCLAADSSNTLLEPVEMNSISDKDSEVSAKDENTGLRKQTKTERRKFGKLARPSSDKDKLRRKVHRRTAKMLFLCTVIYLVTWLPFWFDIFGATKSLILRYLFFVGNATNPIVYGIVNVHIRKAFLRLLGCCEQGTYLSGTLRDYSIRKSSDQRTTEGKKVPSVKRCGPNGKS